MAGFLRKLLSGATHESAHDGERSRDKTDVARIEEARQSGAIALNLRGMASTDLPVWIGELARLEQLDLSDTRLTKLPESIGQLAQLRQLNLKGTRLTELPESIGQLAQLQVLSLSDTKITALPESIGQLAQLRQLDLSGTRLTELPESIGQLARLERLDLRRMNLKRLPRSLCNLNNLTHLFLQGNSALGLPAEMLGPLPNEFPSDLMRIPPGEILEYYFHPSGKRALNEAKLILVGRGEVGKTSIVNRLIYKSFDLYERKTEGINIAPWLLRLAHEVVRLNVWDFGGQEILHATHQFFLTQRSLYILVLDGRSDNAEYDADYWLKLIGSFGGGSPVIIVLNKIKTHWFDINRRALQTKYPSIRGILETDCKFGYGLEKLAQTIAHETDRLDGLRDSFPAAWFKIKEELAGMRHNYLTYKEYCDNCDRLGEPDPAAQETLATYLHRLGIALNYRDDPRLRYTHVLNPHWVTNGIYSILNSELVRKKAGVLNLEDLSTVLNPSVYPSAMHRFLMDLMKKFDLCFPFPEQDIRYLIPELLDIQEPAEAGNFDVRETLNFRYDYPILPEGLLPRFIVRTHFMSAESPRWRTGVILAFEGCRALVKADVQERRVYISVIGPTASRRRLLAVIRAEFEQIHRDIKDLNPVEMVPLPGQPGAALAYSDLLVREANDRFRFNSVINGEVIDLDAHELLEGVDLEDSRREERLTIERDRPVRVFYSYSHKDEFLRNELAAHLTLLRRQNVIDSWHDRLISAGDDWKGKIDENLERAEIVLLLISADFISSEYCYDVEMNRALQRHEEGQAHVVAIILRDANLKGAPFDKFEWLPTDGKAVTLWEHRDSAWRNVSEGIQKLAETMRKERLS